MDGTLVMTASAEQTALEKAFQEFVEATSRMKVIEFAYNQLWPIFIDKMTSWTQLSKLLKHLHPQSDVIKNNSWRKTDQTLVFVSEKLYLYHCELNYDSVNALIRLLKVNESLRALDLEGNGFEKTKSEWNNLNGWTGWQFLGFVNFWEHLSTSRELEKFHCIRSINQVSVLNNKPGTLKSTQFI